MLSCCKFLCVLLGSVGWVSCCIMVVVCRCGRNIRCVGLRV